MNPGVPDTTICGSAAVAAIFGAARGERTGLQIGSIIVLAN